MIILALPIFVSLVLVAGAVALYIHAVRSRTFDHADRLALAPLEDDGTSSDGEDTPSNPQEVTR